MNDYKRRRDSWLLITVAAFLIPSFFLFSLALMLILFKLAAKDENPGAAYCFLLFAIPPVSVPVPMIGMNYLFMANYYLLIAIFLMLPAAWRIRGVAGPRRVSGVFTADFCLISYLLLTSVLYIHYFSSADTVYESTLTNSLRTAFVYLLQFFVPYYVISRSASSRMLIMDILLSFTICFTTMSIIGIFESAKGWALYATLQGHWGLDGSNYYLMRGNSLRAIASAGHSLALGYYLAVGLGLAMGLHSQSPSRLRGAFLIALLAGGSLAAFSRGAWVGIVVILFAFMIFREQMISGLMKAIAVLACCIVVIWLSPFWQKIASVIPFLGGTIDRFNIDYREKLATETWVLIRQSPLLGDQNAMLKLGDLRQGDGIIDFVNYYVQILLNNGFIGLALFLGILLPSLWKLYRCNEAWKADDQEWTAIVASVLACAVGTLVMFAAGSGSYEVYYILAAIAGAITRLDRKLPVGEEGGRSAGGARIAH